MLKDYYQFAGNNRHFLLFGLITAFFGNYGQSFFIAWFGHSFQLAFNLTNTEYGLIYSSATLVSGFLILFVGALLDKTPLNKFTLTTVIGLASACLLLYFSQQIWHLVLAIFLLRFCGQGLMFHIAFTSMARYFEQHRGKAIGIVGFGMPIGEAILPAVAIGLITAIGWRATWLVLAIILIVFFLPIMFWLLKQSASLLSQHKDKSASDKPNNHSGISRKEVIKDPVFWLLLPAIMAPAFIVTGLFIHQAVLLSEKQWSEQWFALGFITYAISHLIASLITGSLVDKYSGLKLLRFYLLPMLLAIVLLALPFNAPLLTLVFMFLMGLTIGASSPIVGSLWVEVYGHQSIAAIRSLVTSIMVFSTALSPVLLGWLFDHQFSFSEVMSYLGLYIVIAWLMSDQIAVRKMLIEH